jgi:hypothetical protein
MKRPDIEICAPPLDAIRAGGQGNGYPAPSALSGPRLDHEHRALNGNVAGAVQGHLARLTWSQVDPAYGGGTPSWRLRSSRAYFAIGHFLRGFEHQVQRKEGRFERSVRCSTVIPHGFLRSQNYRCASIQQRHLPLNLTSLTRRFTIGGFLLPVLAWAASQFILTAPKTHGLQSLLVGINGTKSPCLSTADQVRFWCWNTAQLNGRGFAGHGSILERLTLASRGHPVF